MSIHWFKGKITGNSHISWENLWFPGDFPLSQPIDNGDETDFAWDMGQIATLENVLFGQRYVGKNAFRTTSAEKREVRRNVYVNCDNVQQTVVLSTI